MQNHDNDDNTKATSKNSADWLIVAQEFDVWKQLFSSDRDRSHFCENNLENIAWKPHNIGFFTSNLH